MTDYPEYTCATCYHHMDNRLFENGTKLQMKGKWLVDPKTNEIYEASYTNSSSPIFKTFRTSKLKNLWISCCKAAVLCCEDMLKDPPAAEPDLCPRTWDGWNCWNDTPSGITAESTCPSYIYFHSEEPNCARYATKQCLENGTWYRNEKDREYSDYTTCGQGEEIKTLLNTHVITFGISIVLLIPALGIFFYFRQLRVLRIFMHKNLFISLLLTAIFVIVFESYYIMDSLTNPNNSIESNEAGCKVFYTITKYLRLSTYLWMFCEGFYLHKLIAAAFAEQKSTILFHVIGWCIPALPVGIWAITRKLKADDLCWTVPANHFEWIMFSPMLLALVVNFCFLAHIIQVIITKLRSSHSDEPTQFRRAVRATMVLIPLFGLHFLFLSYHPRVNNCYWQKIYNIVTYSVDGLQGGVVSLIFCYFNNEVLFLLKRTYNRRQMVRSVTNSRRTRTSVSTNAESFMNENSMVNTAFEKK
ncbi:calcitonin gene-related peptide type 1 receptor-like [Uloborus diversus]|uniref:calcitonin gene-related peptide type 1 receptor-like n=1 Tax=Uloborus diversus TaxID=327109 RepID=UPI0024093582|nr:calcitonin gene-related peptide type 1 receptor-like [Uloborus diversus]